MISTSNINFVTNVKKSRKMKKGFVVDLPSQLAKYWWVGDLKDAR